MVYPALLPLMRTPRLPVVDWTDAPPPRFKLTRPFRRKAKSGFCACAITFKTQCRTCLGTASVEISWVWKCPCDWDFRFGGMAVEPTYRVSGTGISRYRLVSFRLRPPFIVMIININTFSLSPLWVSDWCWLSVWNGCGRMLFPQKANCSSCFYLVHVRKTATHLGRHSLIGLRPSIKPAISRIGSKSAIYSITMFGRLFLIGLHN
jgi:hypothetical protein